MRFTLLISVIMCAFSSVSAQGSDHYYFMGYVYSKNGNNVNVHHPYITVLLSLASEPEQIIAARMSDPRGEFNFDGINIDLKRDYLFTVLLPNGKKRQYRCPGGDVKFSPGNINVHLCIGTHDISTSYYTKRNIEFDKKTGFFSKKPNLFDQIAQNAGLTRNGTDFWRDKDEATMVLFLQRFLPPDMLTRLVGVMKPVLITSVTLVELVQPNDYFGGALYIELVDEMKERMGLQMIEIHGSLEEVN